MSSAPPPPSGQQQGPPPFGPPSGGFDGGPPVGSSGGFAPPLPPGGGSAYGPGAGDGAPIDVGAAPSWALKKFQADMGTWLILGAVPLVVLFAVLFGANLVTAVISSQMRGGFVISLAMNAVAAIIGVALVGLAARGLLRAGLEVSRGGQPQLSHLTDFTGIAPYLGLSVIVGVAVGVGSLFCYVPGVVVALVTGFAYTVQLDQQLDPIAAIKASYRIVQVNPGPVLGGLFLAALIGQVGILLCCVGVFFTWPIGWLTNVHLYKQLRGEPIAP